MHFKRIRNRALSFALVTALTIGAIPFNVNAQEGSSSQEIVNEQETDETSLTEGTGVIDVTDEGHITFYADSYKVGDTEYSYDYGNPITLTGTYSYGETDYDAKIVFEDQITATVIFDNLTIGSFGDMINIGTSDITILLKGESTITASNGNYRTAIHTPQGSKLTIKDYEDDEETGVLNATSIGANYVEKLGTITIESGTINIDERLGHYRDDYSIDWQEDDVINIYGGNVTAASVISAGYINIQSGVVSTGTILPCRSLSTGENGDAIISGYIWTKFVQSVDRSTWSCIIAESSGLYKVYGDVTLSQDYTLEDEIQIPAGTSLTIPAGVTFTNNGSISTYGTLDVSEGTYTGTGVIFKDEDGTLIGVEATGVQENPVLNVSKMSTLEIYKDHYIRNGTSYQYSGTITLTTNGNTSSLYNFYIQEEDVDIKFNNVNLSSISNFGITKNATIEITGENKINGHITVSEDVTFTIKGENVDEDTLKITSSGKNSVIGGSSSSSVLNIEGCTLDIENTFSSPSWNNSGIAYKAIAGFSEIISNNAFINTKAAYATDISDVGSITLNDSVLKVDGAQVNNESDIPDGILSQDEDTTSYVLYNGDEITVWLNKTETKLPKDIEVSENQTMTIKGYSVGDLSLNGKTITNNGLIKIETNGYVEAGSDSDTIINNGTILLASDAPDISPYITIEGNQPVKGDFTTQYLQIVEGSENIDRSTSGVLAITGSVSLKGYADTKCSGERLEVSGGTAESPVVLTIEDIDIEGEDSKSAITIGENSYVKIILKGSSIIDGGLNGGAGIEVPESSVLVITCEKAEAEANHSCDENCGSLTVSGGHTSTDAEGRQSSAAIGALYGTKAGSIYIEGGNINATGGVRQYESEHSAGYGSYGSNKYHYVAAIGAASILEDDKNNEEKADYVEGCTLVQISGGNVTAAGRNSGSDTEESINATNVIITGGTVNAGNILATSFSTGESGSGVITADSISDTSSEDLWSGIIFGLSSEYEGVVYGEECIIASDLTISEGKTLTIPEGVTLTIPSGKTLTNNGEIIVEGTLYIKGSIVNGKTGVIVDKANISQDDDSTFTNNGVIKVAASPEPVVTDGEGTSMYKISVGTLPTGCSIKSITAGNKGDYDDGYAVEGATLTITAKCVYGSRITGWTVNGETLTKELNGEEEKETSNPLTLVMSGEITEIAFETEAIPHTDNWVFFDKNNRYDIYYNLVDIMSDKYNSYWQGYSETNELYGDYIKGCSWYNYIGILCLGEYDCDAEDAEENALERKGGKLTINAPSDDTLVYDGTGKAASLTFDGSFADIYKTITGSETLPTADDITYKKWDTQTSSYVDIEGVPEDAGDYRATITIEIYVDDDGNYVIPAESEDTSEYTTTTYSTSVDYTIEQKEISITADDVTKAYGDSDPELTFTVDNNGLAGKDEISSVFTGGLTRDEGETTGTYTINLGSLVVSDSNYKLADEGFTQGTFTIEKALVSIPEITSLSYTGKEQAAIVPESELYSIELNEGGTDVGNYYVVLSLKDTDNYKWDFPGVEEYSPYYIVMGYGITKADNSWTTTPSINGWIYGVDAETPSGDAEFGEVKIEYKASGEDDEKYSTAVPTEAGNYTVRFTVEGTANYKGLSEEISLEIARAEAGIEADTEISRTYGDDGFNLSVSCTGDGTLSYKSSDENVVTVDDDGNVTIVGAGEAAITVTLSKTDNYESSEKGITVKVAPKDITVTADNAEKKFGEDDPELTYTTEGLVGTDTLTGTLEREAGETAGDYSITQGTLIAGSNYNITFKTGTLTIKPNADTASGEVTESPDDTVTTTPSTQEPAKEVITTPSTQEPAKEVTTTTQQPAKKDTTLTVSSSKLKVKVTSSNASNPTVAVVGTTNKKAKTITIPATVKVNGVTYKVTSIANNAFKGNKKITKITIGKNVTKIGKNAFSGCTALGTVTIGKNVTSIGSKAFYKCTKLKKITIPAKVKTIGASAFEGCKKLKKITLTAGKLKTISKKAFKGINKKAVITLKGKKKAKTALKKKLKKKTIGYVKTWTIK